VTRLFASDLHLDPARPEVTEQFLGLLRNLEGESASLFLLGDLFEAWLGDDLPGALGETVALALRQLADTGTAIYLMQGNRDVMLGQSFCQAAGALLLEDPCLLEIHGSRVLLTHGDALCTDDRAYQRLRALLRDPDVRRNLLSLPEGQRRALAGEARAGSRAHQSRLSYEVMDVNPAAVEQVLRDADADVLLHGHTHRPGVHRLTVDGRERTRIVLGDWHSGSSVLRWDEQGYRLLEQPR
jgi:UDP-2,3-diacylglucosamine hydrolase